MELFSKCVCGAMYKHLTRSTSGAVILSVNRNNSVLNNLAMELVDQGDEILVQNIGGGHSLEKLKAISSLLWRLFRARRKFGELICVSNSPISLSIFLLGIQFKSKKIFLHDPILHEGESPVVAFINRRIYGLIKLSTRLEVFVDNRYLVPLAQSSFPRATVKIAKLPYTRSIVEAIPTTFTEHKKYVLFVGRIEQYKGIEKLFRAASGLPSEIRVVIAGRGRHKFRHIPENIEFMGYVEDTQLKNLIKNSLAVVLPYKNATGTQIVPTALALGTRVFLSDIPEFEVYQEADVSRFSDEVELADLINRAPGLPKISPEKAAEYKATYKPDAWKWAIKHAT